MKKKIRVDINYDGTKKKNIYHKSIREFINKIIDHPDLKNEVDVNPGKDMISLLICNDKVIRRISKQYRKIDKSTNELSFSYTNDKMTPYIGEIVLNWDEVIRDSEKCFKDRKITILNLLTHAILHIAGYGHDNIRGEKIMEKMKNNIMKDILGVEK